MCDSALVLQTLTKEASSLPLSAVKGGSVGAESVALHLNFLSEVKFMYLCSLFLFTLLFGRGGAIHLSHYSVWCGC